MIILIMYVKIIAFQTIINHSFGYFILVEKTVVYTINSALTREIVFNTRNKSGIFAHPCIILYMNCFLSRPPLNLKQV